MSRSVVAVCSLAVAGCASIPDVEYTYYMSKMNGVATVAQTVTCAKDMKTVVVVNTPSFVPNYSADLARGPYKIDIQAIEGTFHGFADSDANFSFYDDGRLKSINQSTTGQGETVIKSVVSLATTAAAVASVADIKIQLKADQQTQPSPKTACDVIKDFADTSKPDTPVSVSLSYRAELKMPGETRHSISFAPANVQTEDILKQLKPMRPMPAFTLSIGDAFDPGSRAMNFRETDMGSPGNHVDLKLQRIATVEVGILDSIKKGFIWTANVPIPTAKTYDLPIPSAALFGSQKFTLTLSEAGAITQVEYGKGSGAAGAANAATAILAAESPTTRAGDLRAQADLIAQQQRLNRCQADPTRCQ